MTDFEKQFAQIAAGLNIDDRPTAEHKKMLRQQMLAACKDVASNKTAARIQPLWRKNMKSKAAQGAIAAMVIIGVLFGIYQITGSIDGAAPAFADVVNNVLAQKWVYMFEEDRNSGMIAAEWWYNPREQKVFLKSKEQNGAAIIDLKRNEMIQYHSGTIRIHSFIDDIEEARKQVGEVLPMINGLLEPQEHKGAVITQKRARYNGISAWLYEIELTYPNGGPFTTQHKWLVDTQTDLPIVCEYSTRVESRRYAFDYTDIGPEDIYALGVPGDAEIEDYRPNSETRGLIDTINQVKAEQYQSYAAIIADHDGLPEYFIVRQGDRRRWEEFDTFGLSTEEKEHYLQGIGDSFDSLYQWILNPQNAVLRESISIGDSNFEYNVGWSANKEGYFSMNTHPEPEEDDEFERFCWDGMPYGTIIEDEYSRENGVICVENEYNKRYYDPGHNYLCVREIRKERDYLGRDLPEFEVTPGGILYPTSFGQGGEKRYRIYVKDLDDSLIVLLDPSLLPNYIDHRKLTREIIDKRNADAGPDTPAVTEYTGFTPLHMAIYRKDIDRVKQYLDEGADVEPDSDTGATPMELATASGSLELVKLLHEHGADFISNDQQKRSCLGLAAENRSLDIVQYMLGFNVDVNAVYKEGNTALYYAAVNSDIPMVRTLIEHGAAIDPLNEDGYTPLEKATESYIEKVDYSPLDNETIQQYQQTIRLLVGSGADINGWRDDRHMGARITILLQAVWRFDRNDRYSQQHIELIQFLLELGANPNLMTPQRSPLHEALSRSHLRYDIAEVLLDHGADPWVLPETVSRPGRTNYLEWAKALFREKEMNSLLYPYMKDGFIESNKVRVEAAQKVIKAILSDDAQAKQELCMDHPHIYQPWSRWEQLIKEDYTGHEELLDEMTPGWYTLGGFGEVFVPLPAGSQDECVVLGFFQYPDGGLKCMNYRKMEKMPEPQEYILTLDVESFESFTNLIYEQYGLTENLKARGSASSTSDGNCITGQLVFEVRENQLYVTCTDKSWSNRWCVLTSDSVKHYRRDNLDIWNKYTLSQKDKKLQVLFEPLKCTITSSEKTCTFTLENGQILYDDGSRTVAAEKFTVNMPEVEVEANE
ncbi:MAG: hypothetical protein GXY41_00310 [Phycisphaerae bacterium]|nr:hypothetical protein [Phycisphaerae bacterium]